MNACALWIALAQGAVPIEGLTWEAPVVTQDWFVESEVQLPGFLWLAAVHNEEARVPAWQLRAHLRCDPAVVDGKRTWRVSCRLEEVGLRAATMTADAEVLPIILQEVDARLTGATLELVMDARGDLRAVDLLGLDEDNLRERKIQENLRLLLVRALAGFDLELPAKGRAPYGAWGQEGSLLMDAPTAVGTLGSSEFVHEVLETRGSLAVFQTKGEGMVVPSGAGDQFATSLEAMSVWDTSDGGLSERVWVAVGNPTASSRQAEGGRGFMYRQEGRIRRLAAGRPVPEVGNSEVVAGPGVSETALPAWQGLGLIPTPAPPSP